jgi:integrase
MPNLELTKAAISKIPSPDTDRPVFYWDTRLAGFGLRVSAKTNDRRYVAQHDVNGRTRRVTLGPLSLFKTIDEARERAREELAKMWAGTDPKTRSQKRRDAEIDGGPLTLRRALKLYIARQQERDKLREVSAKDYRQRLERYVPRWLDKPLASITAEMVQVRFDEIKREVAKRKSHPLATGNTTANGVMRTVGIIWRFAARRYPRLGLTADPVAALDWNPEKARTLALEDEQIGPFYRALQTVGSRNQRDYLTLILFTGMRRTETASLKWSSVDLNSRQLHIPIANVKGKRDLDLPLTDVVYDLLVARRALGLPGDFVFPGRSKSGHITEPTFTFRHIEKKTGIHLSSHPVRRTYAQVADRMGIPPWITKQLIGHSLGADVTSKHYTNYGGHVRAESLRKSAQSVVDRLKMLCGISEPKTTKVVKLRGRAASH